MNCFACGRPLTDQAKFCAACGSRVTVATPPPLPPIPTSVPVQQTPAAPPSLSRAKKKALLEQYRQEWRRADRLKYLPLPRWIGMGHRMAQEQKKAELKKKVAEMGVDAEKWEKPLRVESAWLFWIIVVVLIIGFAGYLLFRRLMKP